MCGIAGALGGDALTDDRASNIVKRMTQALVHRGPDDAGTWVDYEAGVALGHRRLSILDLSAEGHQPMVSPTGRYVTTFNGEIYNHAILRLNLDQERVGSEWRGHSDTETLIAGIERWGLEATLQQIVGMFALAVWDRHQRTLHLARDRFGEKPLYYGWVQGSFVFGSELKALRAFPGFANPVCREALAQFLRFTYVSSPLSIYEDIYKLEPGCVLSIQGSPPPYAPTQPLRPGQSDGSVHIKHWWSLARCMDRGDVGGSQHTSDADVIAALDSVLTEAVTQQSLADVPLGAFLSGGVDSSTIVALMQSQATRPVKTFTIGFDEAGFDESPHALAVARHLGTEHHEMRVTAQMAQAVIPKLPQMYDEPFADSSQIPTYLVSKAARQQVTVALSGDAGDELFGGYNRYFWGPRIWDRLSWLPPPARKALGHLVAGIPVTAWDALGAPLGVGKGSSGVARLGDKLHKLGHRLQTVRNIDDLYRSLVSEWDDPASMVRAKDGSAVVEPPSLLDDPLPASGVEHDQLRMMYRDSITYLPDDILCKVDRAAMANSLETRVPFLDHRVVEVAWRLPLNMKIRDGVGKWALRQVLYKYVPKELIERPKAGFAMPIGQWLRGPLRDWADALLNPVRIEQEGFLHPAPVQKVWQQHLRGTHDHTAKLWAVLMFQAWLEENKSQMMSCS